MGPYPTYELRVTALMSPEEMEFCVTVEAIGNTQVLAFENCVHTFNWHSWEIVFFLSRHHCSTVGMKGKVAASVVLLT